MDWKIGWSLSLALLAGAATGRAADEAETTRDIVVAAAEQIKNDDSELKVDIWADRESGTYEIGDEAVFFFKVNRDAYVTLLNIGTSGNITVIFPNRFDQQNYVTAGEVYRLPPKDAGYRFRMSGPKGTEVLKVIATLEPHDLRDRFTPQGDYFSVKTRGAKFFEEDVFPIVDGKDKSKWTESTKIIRTVAETEAATETGDN